MQIIVKLKMQMLSKVMKMMKKMMKKMRKKVRPHQYQINQYRQQSDSSYDSFWRSTYFLLDSSSWIPQELSTHFFFIKKLLICNRVPSPDYKSRICSRFVASLYGANVATNRIWSFYVFTQLLSIKEYHWISVARNQNNPARTHISCQNVQCVRWKKYFAGLRRD